ncbi:phosphatase PAP2 family protein [bacterium]|nr:phosphatase PAP2 family protein [bacterium]
MGKKYAIIFILGISVVFEACQARSRVFVEKHPDILTGLQKKKHKKSQVNVPLPLVCAVEESPLKTITPNKVSNLSKKLCVDFKNIFIDLPTVSTLKTVTAFLPFYLIGRKIDNRVHATFYDAVNHRNVNQPPKFTKIVLNDLFFPLPFIVLGSMGLIHKDAYERRTAQIFAMGVLATWLTKSFIKTLKVDAGLRPLNQNFSPSPRVHGGNPSGHTALAAFMAMYYGLYKGKNYGIPLFFYTGLVGSMAITTNRHYLSQLVAGAGLGVMFGIAAHKVRLALDDELYENRISFGMASDSCGATGFGLAYNF